MFCGLFTPGPEGRQLTHGIADEIIHDLKATAISNWSWAG